MPPQSDKPVMTHLVSDDAARGVELALTPVVFGGIGWVLDGRLGTGPWLTVGLVAFAIVGTVAKLWFGYDAEMRELEASSRWARRPGDAAPPDVPEPSGDLWADRKARP